MIDQGTAERWIDIYVHDYDELPSETYEKTHRLRISPNPGPIVELLAILEIRPKFLERVGATPEQIEWLKRRTASAY